MHMTRQTAGLLLLLPGLSCAHSSATAPGMADGLAAAFREVGHILPLLIAALLVAQAAARHKRLAASVPWRLRPGSPPSSRGLTRPTAQRLLGASFGPGLWFAAGSILGMALVGTERMVFEIVAWPSLLASIAGGLLVALGRGLPHRALMPAVALLGGAHGLAALVPVALIVPDHPPVWPWWLGLGTGTVLGWLLLNLAAAWIIRRHRRWPGLFLRILGSWMAAASVIVLALSWGSMR